MAGYPFYLNINVDVVTEYQKVVLVGFLLVEESCVKII